MSRPTTLKARLALYDREHEFLRRLIVHEEDRAKYTTLKWTGEYRLFRAEAANVVCLEKVRRLKSQDRR